MGIKSKIIRIGNSRGVRLGKSVLKLAEIDEEIDIRVAKGKIEIRSFDQPRKDWVIQILESGTWGVEKLVVPDDLSEEFSLEEWDPTDDDD